jgi:EAL domain-containing protein (putative c-di-GMP-specific phosphodiesterase class I)
VETNLQADFLKNVGCDVAQGYTFSKPIPINEFENFIFTKGKIFFE